MSFGTDVVASSNIRGLRLMMYRYVSIALFYYLIIIYIEIRPGGSCYLGEFVRTRLKRRV